MNEISTYVRSWLRRQVLYDEHNKIFFLHWSKELRIKNTTKERLPVKVVVLAFIGGRSL